MPRQKDLTARRADAAKRARIFYQEWVIVLLLVALAAALRFWRLGDAPPGLYRDEAYNGLDALNVLAGEHALFFPANNGREPTMIYLISAAVGLFGRTAWAVRLPAAVVGTLGVLPIYALARSWYGRRVALISALLWSTTVWPLHLGRIGLRAGLLPVALALFLWLATLAWRGTGRRALWLAAAAGAAYGALFYTYLAAQLTPLAGALLAFYLWWRGRLTADRRWVAFGAAALLVVLPLGLTFAANPALLGGRSGQVSIFSPTINGGDLAGTLLRQLGATAGMFIWRGDTIGRHNIPGRPVFDALLALPFVVGLLWALWQARRSATAAALLIWPAVMLIGTLLAEDAPHFLRAVGVLPLILIFPALGLSLLWDWSTLSPVLRRLAVVLLLVGSAAWSVNSYFGDYARRPQTAYLFDAAARTLAAEANVAAADGATVWLDRRYREGWPSIPFLLTQPVQTFDAQSAPPPAAAPQAVLFVWPYGPRDFVRAVLPADRPVSIVPGDLVRGDLDAEAVLLTVRYQTVAQPPTGVAAPVNFDNQIWLLQAAPVDTSAPGALPHVSVDLLWRAAAPTDPPLTAFVHVVQRADGRLIGQSDAPPGGGHWPPAWWQPQQPFGERRSIALDEQYDPARHAIVVGVYDAATLRRRPIIGPDGIPTGGDAYTLPADGR